MGYAKKKTCTGNGTGQMFVSSSSCVSAGFGTLPWAGCRGIVGPVPPPLLIRAYKAAENIIAAFAGLVNSKCLEKEKRNGRKMFGSNLVVDQPCKDLCIAAFAGGNGKEQVG